MCKMRMTCTSAVAVALLLALAAPVAAQEAEPAASIEGTVVGDHWIDVTAPVCDPGTSWRFSSAGSGQLLDIGEVDYFLTQCTVFDAEGGADPIYDDATTVLTTADGATLVLIQQFTDGETFVDDAGQFTGFTLVGTWEAIGGTGHLMFAAGNGTIDAAADIPGEIVFDLTGELTTDPPAPPAE